MLVCMLLIAKEANLKLLSIGISWRSLIWCFVLLMWKRIGKGDICWCGVSEGNFASLKAEAFCELTIGAVNPLVVGAVGCSLQYFHLFSFDIITLMFFLIFVPTFLWHIFVGSVPEVGNTFLVRNSYIFVVIVLILAWILTVRHECTFNSVISDSRHWPRILTHTTDRSLHLFKTTLSVYIALDRPNQKFWKLPSCLGSVCNSQYRTATYLVISVWIRVGVSIGKAVRLAKSDACFNWFNVNIVT